MEALTVQYQCYNQRRLHYSWLFWACLALYISGTGAALFLANMQYYFPKNILLCLLGLGGWLLAFIAWRLHGQEVHYENLLAKIEKSWIDQGLVGIQQAKLTGGNSSRKIVVFAVALSATAIFIYGLVIGHLYPHF